VNNLKTKDIGVKSYIWWYQFLGGKNRRTINHNTYVRYDSNQNIDIILHNTPILTINPSNYFIYNTAGWRSVTTKRRLNELGPLALYQRDYCWYIRRMDNNTDVEYFDGIMVDTYCNKINS
jgi:hypothetical protein